MKMTEKLSGLSYKPLYYEPKERPNIKLEDTIDLTKVDKKLEIVNKSKLPDKQKALLRLFCYRFIKIDFESVADYYFFNASEEEKKIIERLRLVLVDDGSVGGFIEDDLLHLSESAINYLKSLDDEKSK